MLSLLFSYCIRFHKVRVIFHLFLDSLSSLHLLLGLELPGKVQEELQSDQFDIFRIIEAIA